MSANLGSNNEISQIPKVSKHDPISECLAQLERLDDKSSSKEWIEAASKVAALLSITAQRLMVEGRQRVSEKLDEPERNCKKVGNSVNRLAALQGAINLGRAVAVAIDICERQKIFEKSAARQMDLAFPTSDSPDDLEKIIAAKHAQMNQMRPS